MQTSLLPAVGFLVALLLSFANADAAVQWTLTTRLVGGESIVSTPAEFAIQVDSQTSEVSGLFAAAVSVDTTVAGVAGTSMADQNSTLSSTGLTGSGGFQTTTAVTDPDGFADVFGRSLFNGYFDIDAPTPYSLTGQLTSGGGGTSTQMALFGPGGAIVDVHASPGTTVPVSASGTLAPGSYLVTVSAAGNAQELPPNLLVGASGEWEMEFQLGSATAAPSVAWTEGILVFPNPSRGRTLISLGSHAETPTSFRIHDVAGRVVRVMDTTSGVATWDTRDASGRPVPAGVYLVTAQEDGRFTSRKVTVLR
ncbi:MAG: hypothetical protein DHS20C21_08370 [Gemmatimonadota bacterium]|nr:MAG: hypothetical protein DHS20C21_08370 [Gemmatimonadota bacterium]